MWNRSWCVKDGCVRVSEWFKPNLNNYDAVIKNTATFIDKVKSGIISKLRKTKVMELLGNDQELFTVWELFFEKIEQFKYLGVTIKSNNDWCVE